MVGWAAAEEKSENGVRHPSLLPQRGGLEHFITPGMKNDDGSEAVCGHENEKAGRSPE